MVSICKIPDSSHDIVRELRLREEPYGRVPLDKTLPERIKSIEELVRVMLLRRGNDPVLRIPRNVK